MTRSAILRSASETRRLSNARRRSESVAMSDHTFNNDTKNQSTTKPLWSLFLGVTLTAVVLLIMLYNIPVRAN